MDGPVLGNENQAISAAESAKITLFCFSKEICRISLHYTWEINRRFA